MVGWLLIFSSWSVAAEASELVITGRVDAPAVSWAPCWADAVVVAPVGPGVGVAALTELGVAAVAGGEGAALDGGLPSSGGCPLAPVRLKVDGARVAVLGASARVAACDPAEVLVAAIGAVRIEVDLVVAVVEWAPGAPDLDLARRLSAAGAGVVIGHGSGRIGPVERLIGPGVSGLIAVDVGSLMGPPVAWLGPLQRAEVGDAGDGLILRVPVAEPAAAELEATVRGEGAPQRLTDALAAAQEALAGLEGDALVAGVRARQRLIDRARRIETLVASP